MPDWRNIVSTRLADLRLQEGEREEVFAELAGHLEETYESLRREGLPEHEAIRGALSQVRNWNRLQRRICAAKEHPVKQRVQQLWVPGFLTLILSVVTLIALQKQGVHPRILSWTPRLVSWSRTGPDAILFHGPWLVCLFFLGGIGAYLSRRAGASWRTALVASVFPVVALTAAFLLMFPIDLIVKWIIRMPTDFRIVSAAMLKEGISWLLIPGVTLLVGGLLGLLFNPHPSQVSKVADA
jgi:hypothetical protein